MATDLFASGGVPDGATPTAGADLFADVATKPSPFKEGFGAGVSGVKSNLYGAAALAAHAVGASGVEAGALERANAASEEAAARSRSIEQIDWTSPASITNHFKYLLGNAVPSLATMALGGAAGRGFGAMAGLGEKGMRAATLAGAVAPDFALEAGGVYPEALKTGVENPAARAAVGGAAAASLDFVPLLAAEKYMKAAGKGGLGAMAKGAVKGSVLGAGLEGTQEALQSVVERAAAGQSLTDADAISDYVNSFAGGAVPGLAFGGVTGAMHNRTAPVQPAPTFTDREQPAAVNTPSSPAAETATNVAETPTAAAVIPTQQPPLGIVPKDEPLDLVPQTTPLEDAWNSHNAIEAQHEDLSTQVDAAAARVKSLEAEQPSKDRPKRELVLERRQAAADLTDLKTKAADMATRLEDAKSVISTHEILANTATGSNPNVAPKVDTPESSTIETKPPVADTTPAETAVAQVKRGLGMLVSSREAKLAPLSAREQALEIVNQRSDRKVDKQVDEKTRQGAVETAAITAAQPQIEALASAANLSPRTTAVLKNALNSIAQEAAKKPTNKEAQAHIAVEVAKALKGHVKSVDAAQVAASMINAVTNSNTLYSKGATNPTVVYRGVAEGKDKIRSSLGASGVHGVHFYDRASLAAAHGSVMDATLKPGPWAHAADYEAALAATGRDQKKASALLKKQGFIAVQHGAEIIALDPSYVVQSIQNSVGALTSEQFFGLPQDAQEAAVDFYDRAMGERGEQLIARLRDMIGDDPKLKVQTFQASPGSPIGGYTRLGGMKSIISMALNAKNELSIADHEGFHYAEDRILNPRERQIVRDALRPGSRMFKQLLTKVQAYDRENKTRLADEIIATPAEARAYGFEFWKRGELQAEGSLAAAFRKIQEFFDKVGNYVKGLGFQSIEDIYTALDRGQYAEREKNDFGGIGNLAETFKSDAAIESVADFAKTLTKNNPKVTTILGEYPNGVINLKGLQVKDNADRGQGKYGAAAMRELTAFADSQNRGVMLLAYPEDATKMPLAKLVQWYEGHGFKALDEQEYTEAVMMYRDPQGESYAATQENTGNAAGSGTGQGTSAEQDAGTAETNNPDGQAAAKKLDTLFSRAASDAVTDMDRRYRAGELEREQMQNTVAGLVDDAKLSALTAKQAFGAIGEQFLGSLQRWRLKNIATGNYVSRFSTGYANVQKTLLAYVQRKSSLIAQGSLEQLSTWHDNATSQADITAVGDVLLARTEKGMQVGSPEFTTLRNTLTVHQQSMLDQATKMIADRLQHEFAVDQVAMQKILPDAEYKEWFTNRQTQVDRLIADGYVPERRYGDYTVHIYLDSEDKTGKPERLTLHYEQFENQAAADVRTQQYAKLLEKEAPELKVETGYRYKVERDASISIQQFMDTARRNGIDLTQAERERLAKALVSADSMRRNRMFQRKNIPGYSSDIMRVLHEFVVTTANKVAYSEFASPINDAIDGRPVDARTENGVPTSKTDNTRSLWKEDGPQSGFFRNLSDELVDYVLVPDHGGNWSRKLRGAAMTYFIGGSLASGAVNAMSIPMNVVPFLSQSTGYANAASKTFASMGMTLKNFKALRDIPTLKDASIAIPSIDAIPGLRAALITAAEDGRTMDTEIHQIMGMAQGASYANSRKVQKAMDVWMAPFKLTEQVNRITTFIAAYRIGVENNLGGRQLYEFAAGAVDGTQNRYDEVNRPGMARDPMWALLFMFKSFPMFMVEMVEGMYRQNPKSATYMLLGLVAMTGVQGLPFAEGIEDLIDTISQRIFHSPFNTRRAMRNMIKDASEAVVGADLSELVLRGGINDLTGMSVSSRIGMGDFVPGTRIGAADSDYGKTAEQILGAPFSMLTSVGSAAGKLTKGEFLDALKSGGPAAIRNMIKGAEQLDRGYAQDAGGRKLVDVTGPEALWQAAGFSSASLNKAYEMDKIDKQTLAFYTEARRDFMNQMVRAVKDGDQVKAQETMDTVKAWNDANPDMPISFSPATLRRDIVMAGLPLNARTLQSLPKQLRGTSVAAEGISQ